MTIALSATGTALGMAVAVMTLCGVAATAAAQVVVSANDNKLTLNDGVQTVVIATLDGGPTIEVGTRTSPTTFG